MRSAAFVIYQVVTSSQGNISCADGSGLCSKVSGVLNFPAPLAALPLSPEQRVTGGGEAALVTGEELCQRVNCQRSPGSEKSLILADEYSFPRLPNATIRQQFLLALLEDCSFFAHLVLRCVRAGDGPHLDVAAPLRARSRATLGMQRRTRPATYSNAQRELEDLPADPSETSFPELETLWAEMVSRHVRVSIREGGTP